MSITYLCVIIKCKYFIQETEGGKLTHLELLPIELGFGEARYRSGNPKFCPDGGIIERYAEMSVPYGTKVDINSVGIGVVKL